MVDGVVRTRVRRWRGIGVATCAVLAAGCGFVDPGPEPAPLGPPQAVTGSDTFAPYVDVSLGQPADLASVLWDNKVKHVNLGFITDAGRCTPQWSGLNTLHDRSFDGRLDSLRAMQEAPRISFGGAAGAELAAGCPDVDSLASAYRRVVDDYRITQLDFDLESQALGDPGTVARRNRAISKLQATARESGHPIDVTYTLPTTPTGLDPQAEQAVRDAVVAGVQLSAVNILAMDYGQGVTGNLGSHAADAATGLRTFLGSLWPAASDGELWSKVAVTAMLGRNDDPAETFTPDDARVLVDFAKQHHLGWLSFWSLSRDMPCPPQPNPDSQVCSGIDQRPSDFTRIFRTYRG